MRVEPRNSLEQVDPSTWNAMAGEFPFLRHEFLVALERHGALGRAYGWIPYYLLLRDDDGALAGAAPTFLKLNSYGEFVFDFAWAHAYERHGLRYYPKLVAAAPYTPATGPRLLVAADRDPAEIRPLLARAIVEHCAERSLSSCHWLFPVADELEALRDTELLIRSDIQYHWTNAGYRDFDDFLDAFSSRKRKKARRERRRVGEQGITLERHTGDRLDAADWATVHHFYEATFERKWNVPVLTRSLFEELGRTMGDRIVVVFARAGGRVIAVSVMFRGGNTLYGRYWGCDTEYHSLHFEACYYQGIEYAIEQGLQRFEPGAQGEHKIARGFLPTWTRSAHWIAHPDFRRAIAQHLAQEHRLLEQRHALLMDWSPFRRAEDE